MGKIKIHELSKKINVTSKEIIEKAMKLGIEAKSHLSSIEEEDAKRIEKDFEGKKQATNKEDEKPKEEKRTGPVIIRREVIVSREERIKEEESKKKEEENKRADIGVVQKERNKDFNIVYRNKPVKPLTVNDLFGKKEEKKIEEEPVVDIEIIEKEETAEGAVHSDPKPATPISSEENKPISNNVPFNRDNREQRPYNNNRPQRPYDNNRQFNNNNRPYNNNSNNNNRPYNNNSRPFNNDNRPYNNNNNRPYNNNNRPFNNNNRPFNNDNRPFNNNNRPFNNNNRPFNNNRPGGNRPFDNNRRIEKNIKDIVSSDFVEKEGVIDYTSKVLDKQKYARNDEQKNKKLNNNNRSRRVNSNELDTEKLRNLTQEKGLSNMFDDHEGGMFDYYDLTTERGRKARKKSFRGQEEQSRQQIFDLTDITIPETITVKDFAIMIKKTSGEIIKKLLGYGVMATLNNEIDFDTSTLIANEFGINVHKQVVVTEEDVLFDESDDKEEELVNRAPVVVVMGHVDHGKTSLLDALRSANVMEGESGGITQHIGAYKVEINGREITFLDTPGHEAFTSMRARGAQITDIAILVIAANDGIMPQTIEAINHAKAAGIPIIVAVNKIDLPDANIEKIKQSLTEYELVPEEWGGDTIFVPISAKKRMNLENLLEMVLLVADMKNLKTNPNKQAKGTVIEAKLDKNKGPVATMLVQRGTLDVGDTILVGSVIGRIRSMVNDKGMKVKKAGPSTPVEITGLTEVPVAGETFYEVEDEKTAKQLMERRKIEDRNKTLNANTKVTLNDLFSEIEKGNLKQLNLIVKADVQGSVEAIKQSMEKLSNNEIRVKVIHASAGGVTESDVNLAKVSNGIIIAFNVRADIHVKSLADKDGIDIKTYSVIYHAIEDVEAAMKGMLAPKYKEVILGTAEIRQVFKVSNVGTIAGAYVLDGKLTRNSKVRVIRDDIVIFTGALSSLKRFKDDVKEVGVNYECGIQIEGFDEIKEGDKIESFTEEEIK